MEKFLGKWEVMKTENMDEMLKAFDMEEAKRKLYSDMKFVMEYKRAGDEWSYTVFMPNGEKTFTFKDGEEFDSYTLDGRPIISKICVDDGKFKEFHKDKNDTTLDAVMERVIDENDQLIVKATVRNIQSFTTHKRV